MKSHKFTITVLCLSFAFFYKGSLVFADQFDNWTNSYEQLLKKYLTKSIFKGIPATLVNYAALRKDPLVKKLKSDLAKMPSVWSKPKNKQLAFWINTYNFLTLAKVAENPGLKKLTDLNKLFKNVWNQPAGIVSGKMVTLDWIEHKILRKRYNEPRIHIAIVCAALSCPDLRKTAYRANLLDKQLNEQLLVLKNNQKKGIYINHNKKEIYVSKIFKWFKKDFYNGDLKRWLIDYKLISNSEKKYQIDFLDYDWRLNSIPGKN